MIGLRRARAPCLSALYDEGVQAARKGSSCPYVPPAEHGDHIRAHLWNQGHEDAQEDLEIEALV